MGSEYQQVFTDTPAEKLEEWFRGVRDQALYDYGHAGYTGSFAEASGIERSIKSFDSKEDAGKWLQENAEKWGPALAVKVPGGWLVGAWCSC